jgi:GTP cyclohydrolase FolE2
VVAGAYAVTVQAQVAILTTFNMQIKLMQEQVGTHFGRHPDVEVYLSQPCQRSRNSPSRP